jgi:hypothetical protein
MTPIITLVHEGSGDATRELEHKLATVVVVSDVVSQLVNVKNPVPELAAKITELLESPVGTLVDSAWSAHRAVRDAIAETSSNPNASRDVSLDDEQLTISDTLSVKFDHVVKATIAPTLNLVLDIESLVITVVGGQIAGIGKLNAKASGNLMLDGHVLLSREPRHVFTLDEMLVLPEPASAPARSDTMLRTRRVGATGRWS